jgi:hypothetical protein
MNVELIKIGGEDFAIIEDNTREDIIVSLYGENDNWAILPNEIPSTVEELEQLHWESVATLSFAEGFVKGYFAGLNSRD